MATKPLSPHELRVWHAFRLMNEDVLARVGQDIAQATGLSGPEFAVLSRLEALPAEAVAPLTECVTDPDDGTRLNAALALRLAGHEQVTAEGNTGDRGDPVAVGQARDRAARPAWQIPARHPLGR